MGGGSERVRRAWAARAGLPPGFVAGVTAPQYGMPISGTPIGLPGPPHIPLGVPAGLQKHVIMQPHARCTSPVRIKHRQDQREARAGLQLSEAGQSRADQGYAATLRPRCSSNRWRTGRETTADGGRRSRLPAA